MTEFFCYSDFRYKVTEYLCSEWIFFHQRNFDCLTNHFWRIFLLFRLSIQSNGIFVLGLVFFLRTIFDFLTSHFWRSFFVIPNFDTKVPEYLCSGWIFFIQTNIEFLTRHFWRNFFVNPTFDTKQRNHCARGGFCFFGQISFS